MKAIVKLGGSGNETLKKGECMMKRKFWLMGTVALAALALVACGSGSKEKAAGSSSASSTKESSEVAQSASSVQVEQSVIKGVLKEDVTVDGDNVSFFMIDVTAVEDPTEFAKSIGEEGVIMNAESKQVEGEFKPEDFKAGQEVEVTLEGNAITTRSLPPQVPGVSIISIKKL